MVLVCSKHHALQVNILTTLLVCLLVLWVLTEMARNATEFAVTELTTITRFVSSVVRQVFELLLLV